MLHSCVRINWQSFITLVIENCLILTVISKYIQLKQNSVPHVPGSNITIFVARDYSFIQPAPEHWCSFGRIGQWDSQDWVILVQCGVDSSDVNHENFWWVTHLAVSRVQGHVATVAEVACPNWCFCFDFANGFTWKFYSGKLNYQWIEVVSNVVYCKNYYSNTATTEIKTYIVRLN